MEDYDDFVVIVSRIKHVKVGWRLNVTDQMKDQRWLSSCSKSPKCRIKENTN